MRILFFTSGCLALVLGIIGIVLPVLPTTPFVLLAAYCFAQSSSRFHEWLVKHPLFGPFIHDWQTHRAIPKKAKYLAFSMMTLSCAMLWYRLWATPWLWLAGLLSLVCAGVMVWMWRLPSS